MSVKGQLSDPHRGSSEEFERRLSDMIARAFFRAHASGDSVTAGHLLNALESLTARERALFPVDRRGPSSKLDEVKALLVLQTTDVGPNSGGAGQAAELAADRPAASPSTAAMSRPLPDK